MISKCWLTGWLLQYHLRSLLKVQEFLFLRSAGKPRDLYYPGRTAGFGKLCRENTGHRNPRNLACSPGFRVTCYVTSLGLPQACVWRRVKGGRGCEPASLVEPPHVVGVIVREQ